MRAVARVRDFAQKGFRLLGLRPPDLEMKAYLDDCSARLIGLPSNIMLPLPVSLCGKLITANDTLRKVTIGGTIIVDGSYFALTVAHVFLRPTPAQKPNFEDSTPQLFDMDWAMESDGESDNDDSAYDSGHESAQPERFGDVQTTEEAYLSASPSENLISPHARTLEIDRPRGLNVKMANSSQDWAIMELDDHKFFGVNEVQTGLKQPSGDESWAYLLSASSKPSKEQIVVASYRGTLEARITQAPCIGKLRGSEIDTKMWAIHTHGSLQIGVCGSWAFDAQNQEIIGYIVSGSDFLEETFLIPLADVLLSIKEHMGASVVRLPTLEDSLWLAVYFGNAKTARRLIDTLGALPRIPPEVPIQDPVFQLNKDAITMLHWSAMQGYLELSELLVSAGADINARTKSRKPPHLASFLDAPPQIVESDSEAEINPERSDYPMLSATADKEYHYKKAGNETEYPDALTPTFEDQHLKEWTWDPEAQDHYIRKWRGHQWSVVWAKDQEIEVAEQMTIPTAEALERSTTPEVSKVGITRMKLEHLEASPLDPAFMVQPNPQSFFIEGRMFAALFAETLGPTAGLETSDMSTYGGRGTAKKGLDPQTHAVMYTTGSAPRYVTGEVALKKTPILVVPADRTIGLATASRINFAIQHPISHTVKAKNLGMIHPSLVSTLLEYAEAESGTDGMAPRTHMAA
ncbi:hypothetical protein MPH_07981 [Macrophomina phaseolina MS6]|uniref:DUF6590 domain-containing protein n=1 Tax=Macrophomina phaseolina (strain MS6) TaxID=1126212 RepID=K2RJM9_MACPH|nr:hypothetical protein MPH_07981 [Macrophomina phaseolina MS6]